MRSLRILFSIIPLLATASLWAQCSNYTIDAGGGYWDNEISWNLLDASGAVVASDVAVFGLAVCLDDGCYTLEMFDSFGDGWDGANWTITDASGVQVTSETITGGGYGTAMVGLNDPDCGAPPCPNPYTVNAGGGLYDSEISWSLNDASGTQVAFGTSVNGLELCLDDGCYTLILNDSFADGWNGAVWTLTDSSGDLLASETLGGGGYGEFEVGVNDPSCNPPPCPDAYTFIAGGGYFPGEISWAIFDESYTEVASGFATPGTLICLDSPHCYTLELYDSFSDGWDGAVWVLQDPDGNQVDTGTLAQGGFGWTQISLGGAECESPYPDQLEVTTGTLTAAQLITDVFLGDCLEASNISYTGNPDAIGTFTNGGGIGIEDGIVISTGAAEGAEGPNFYFGQSTSFFSGGDALLDNLSGSVTDDAAIFEFDFMASTSEVTFTYVFASEEYDEYVCQFNDAFGFFVSGPGYANNTNIAAIPGTSDLVSINNINNDAGCGNPAYAALYVNNDNGQVIEYDAYTVPLEATITTVPCETYQIKIAIADADDSLLDSAVLLKAESFNAGIDMDVAAASPSGGQSDAANCEDLGSFLFALNGDPLDEDAEITFTIGGSATPGVDYDPLPGSITFPAGTSIFELDVLGYLDQLDETPESITLTLDNVCSCSDPESITLYLCSLVMLGEAHLDLQAELVDGQSRTRLTWQTSASTIADRFIMEVSRDGEHWDFLFEEAGLEETGSVQFYQGWDLSPVPGYNYYRVRMIDLNGNQFMSPIRSVERTLVPDPILLPNPSDGSFEVLHGEDFTFRIFDQRGRQVAVSQTGPMHFALNQPAAGLYTVAFERKDGTVLFRRWVVQ